MCFVIAVINVKNENRGKNPDYRKRKSHIPRRKYYKLDSDITND